MTMTAELTPLAIKILDVLRGAKGAWLTRKDIASAIGRQPAVLQEYDRVLLERLAEAGLIEASTRPRGVASVTHIYRAKKAS